jgi:hypothetical protein
LGRAAEINHDLGRKTHHCIYSDGGSKFISVEELEQIFHYGKLAMDENRNKIEHLGQKTKERHDSSETPK